MSQILQNLLYAGLSREAFDHLLPAAARDNERSLRTYSLLAFLVFVGLIIANRISKGITLSNQKLYVAMAAISGLIQLCVRRVTPKRPALLIPLAYLFMAALYAFSLRLTLLHPGLPSVTTIVLMFAVPFMLEDRPIRLVCLTALVTVALCVIAQRFKPTEVARMDQWNAVSFAAIASVVEVLQQKTRFHSLEQAQKIKFLSETDLLTGAKNRNCFEASLGKYAGSVTENLTCVYIDVNGLHELNDAMGHRAGDAMLQAVAGALAGFFGGDHLYRIGGDEFVAFRTDAPPEQTRQQMRRIAAELESKGYHISAGIADAGRQSLDMDALTAAAEADMYRDKRDFYRQSGHDRRKR